jgi:hypothetical protein
LLSNLGEHNKEKTLGQTSKALYNGVCIIGIQSYKQAGQALFVHTLLGDPQIIMAVSCASPGPDMHRTWVSEALPRCSMDGECRRTATLFSLVWAFDHRLDCSHLLMSRVGEKPVSRLSTPCMKHNTLGANSNPCLLSRARSCIVADRLIVT